MKILHVIANLAPRYGGPSKACREMARAVAQLGHEVSIYTTNQDGPGELEVPLGQPVWQEGVEIRYFPIQAPRFWGTSLPLALALRRQIPAGVTEMLQLPGLGPKRVRALYEELHVTTLPALARAARDGRIRALPGFGARTEARILEAIEAHGRRPQRLKLVTAAQYAAALIAWLRRAPGVSEVAAAGSLRRSRETVGDLDLLACAPDGAAVCRHMLAYPEVAEVRAAGDTRATVLLASGLQVDLRVVAEASFGAALLYFTGSKAHNIRLRTLAIERRMKLNEYGLFAGRRTVAAATEQEIYGKLGLPWIPPELREDRGEIEAAMKDALPVLIERRDLAGDLHAHTDWSDGAAGIEAMARAAQAHGLSYLAISDHSRRLTVAHGLDPPRLARQCAEVEALNRRLAGIELLTGIEVDVLDDGSLDLPEAALAPLEVVIAAVHSKFDLSRAAQRLSQPGCSQLAAYPSAQHLQLNNHPRLHAVLRARHDHAEWRFVIRQRAAAPGIGQDDIGARNGLRVVRRSVPIRGDRFDAGHAPGRRSRSRCAGSHACGRHRAYRRRHRAFQAGIGRRGEGALHRHRLPGDRRCARAVR